MPIELTVNGCLRLPPCKAPDSDFSHPSQELSAHLLSILRIAHQYNRSDLAASVRGGARLYAMPGRSKHECRTENRASSAKPKPHLSLVCGRRRLARPRRRMIRRSGLPVRTTHDDHDLCGFATNRPIRVPDRAVEVRGVSGAKFKDLSRFKRNLDGAGQDHHEFLAWMAHEFGRSLSGAHHDSRVQRGHASMREVACQDLVVIFLPVVARRGAKGAAYNGRPGPWRDFTTLEFKKARNVDVKGACDIQELFVARRYLAELNLRQRRERYAGPFCQFFERAALLFPKTAKPAAQREAVGRPGSFRNIC